MRRASHSGNPQGVGDNPGRAQADDRHADAADPEDRGPWAGDDPHGGRAQRRAAGDDAFPPVGRDLEFRAQPAAEHRGEFRLRNALARHPNLGQGVLPSYES